MDYLACGISNLIKVKLSKQSNYFLLYQKSHMWLWLIQLLCYSWYLHSQQLECHQDGRLTALKRNNICEKESLILCILKKHDNISNRISYKSSWKYIAAQLFLYAVNRYFTMDRNIKKMLFSLTSMSDWMSIVKPENDRMWCRNNDMNFFTNILPKYSHE